ncbi:MAG: DNA polymerase thumb domain-containing protein [Halanaerobiales bacterium]
MERKVDYEKLPQKNILCVDMKAFYASIEAVDRGLDPQETCLAVVGDKKRRGGVVLAATPAIKEKYGIGTASRVYQIPQKSDIKIVEARMGLYLDVSLEITKLFNEYVPLDAIHVYSVDESWLKLDGTEDLWGNSREVAEDIKKELLNRYSLSCSMGLGPNMFLSKVAMDVEGKKKGLAEWTYDDVPEKLWPLPLKKCWGIGNRLSYHLEKIGVTTVGDLAHLPLSYLENKFGIMGNQLYYHAWGVDLSEVEGHYQDRRRSLGRGITLMRDYHSLEEIKTIIFDLCEEVGRRARLNGLAGKTVNLGLDYSKEEREDGFYRQQTRANYTNITGEIYDTAVKLLKKYYEGQRVRKVRVALSNLSPSFIQLSLFADREKISRLNHLKDRIQSRYDHQALFYGRSLKKGSVRKKINTTIGGHKK